MAQQIRVNDDARLDGEAVDGLIEITADVAYQRLGLVNVVYYGDAAGKERWVLIDAGLPGTARAIMRCAESRFGKETGPDAVVLTHGHFDHVGALEELAKKWNVPIYAHPLEHPFLTGIESYPPPDPSVGGGLMSTLSRFYPRGPIDVRHWLKALQANGRVPGMPGWQWIETLGHTAGHISLWREADRTLIVGDAFITTAQESAYAVLTQQPELHGPPMYYTTDWDNARASVARLADLQPEVIISGHGPPMHGSSMRDALDELVDRFDVVAIPDQGRYVIAQKFQNSSTTNHEWPAGSGRPSRSGPRRPSGRGAAGSETRAEQSGAAVSETRAEREPRLSTRPRQLRTPSSAGHKRPCKQC